MDLQTYTSYRLEPHATSQKPAKGVSSGPQYTRVCSCLHRNRGIGTLGGYTAIMDFAFAPAKEASTLLHSPSPRLSDPDECRFSASADTGMRYFSDCNVGREFPRSPPIRSRSNGGMEGPKYRFPGALRTFFLRASLNEAPSGLSSPQVSVGLKPRPHSADDSGTFPASRPHASPPVARGLSILCCGPGPRCPHASPLTDSSTRLKSLLDYADEDSIPPKSGPFGGGVRPLCPQRNDLPYGWWAREPQPPSVGQVKKGPRWVRPQAPSDDESLACCASER